ncbi:EamA family transporter [Flavobacterium bizetiae]|jgi:drug/metabolite transporter (DMT)-like permease|uniref:EamA family transporter n=1 Tax=Flavobacterium bizetiae TaxID=2704140 RepID=UPI00375736F7
MTKYITLVALGALSFGMLSSFAKIAYGQGYNAGEITFTQAALGAIILWSIVIYKNIRKGSFSLKGNWKLFLAGSSMGTSAYTYYLSVEYIPASLAIVLLMQMTWISIMAEWLFFKKKPSSIEVIATLIIIAGTVFAGDLLNLEHFDFPLIGIVLGLSSALLYSLYVIFTSKLGNDVPMFEKSALMTTGSAMVILLINLKSITASTHLDLGLLQWGGFLALFGTVIPPICFTTGIPKIGAGLSSILLTLELPAAVFCAHLILNEKITFLQTAGIAIMLGAIIYLNIAKSRKDKKQKTAVSLQSIKDQV